MTEHDRLIESVWLTGEKSLTEQLVERRYVERTRTDRHAIPPAIADYAVTAFSRPGDIVLDPDCGAGTAVVESLRAGRHTIGLTDRPRWWRIARANVTATKARGAVPDGMVLVLNRRTGTITAATTAGLTGRVTLILTALRPAPADVDSVGRLHALLVEARPLLRLGGHVVVTTRPVREPSTGALRDQLDQILTAGASAGLVPIKRCIAVTAAIRGRAVTPHDDPGEQHSTAPVMGSSHSVVAHHPVVVFGVDSEARDTALALLLPQTFVSPSRIRRRKPAAKSRRTTLPSAELAA